MSLSSSTPYKILARRVCRHGDRHEPRHAGTAVCHDHIAHLTATRHMVAIIDLRRAGTLRSELADPTAKFVRWAGVALRASPALVFWRTFSVRKTWRTCVCTTLVRGCTRTSTFIHRHHPPTTIPIAHAYYHHHHNPHTIPLQPSSPITVCVHARARMFA